MEYQKQEGSKGAWLEKTIELNGKIAKLVSETKPEVSNFKNKDGSVKMQDVVKIEIEGAEETKNFSLTKPTINALIDAFGADSKDWIDKPLTVVAEKIVVSGKRGVMVNLIPEGFQMGEDENGYMLICKKETLADVKYPTENNDPDNIPL